MHILASLFLAAALQTSSASPGTFLVDTGVGVGLFEVTDPAAAVSPALRLNDDLAAKDGTVPAPTAGWDLSGRVLVETDDAALLVVLASELAPGSRVSPLDGVAGFWLVDAGSVAEGIALAAALDGSFGDAAVYLDVRQPHAPRLPNDPMLGQQWHLINNSNPLFDVNIEGAWNAGFTGAGVVVGITDGGVNTSHPDLAANFNSAGSQGGGSSSHGSSCAGVAAAVGDNGVGVTGAAYGAQWSKQYYGFSSSSASAFAYRNDVNDIKNNSWGPSDNGRIHYMTSAEYNAIETAATTGRQGLGTIFCWAAGNGGLNDRVEYDPYAASRYTLAIGAIGNLDTRSSYNEQGSSMTVVAQSSGNTLGITTTSSSGYTSGFGGTSSASPLGAGVVALVLEANPALSWRDVTGVLIESARINHPSDPDWQQNGTGRDVSLDYGFGSIDATAAVTLAQSWTSLPTEQTDVSGVQAVNQTIPDNNPTGVVRTWNCAQDITLEAVEVIVNIQHTYIGDVEVELVAPSGTVSLLTKQRSDGTDNMNDYRLTSLRHWGESSQGTWTLRVSDRDPGTTGTWEDFEIKVFGHDAVGGGGLAISAPPAVAGQTLSVYFTGGVSGQNTWLTYSLAGIGSTFVPQLGLTLDLASPVLAAGPVQVNPTGAGAFTVPVPANAAGRSYWLQALEAAGTSNVLSGTVQ